MACIRQRLGIIAREYDEAVDEFRMAQAIADSLGDPYMMAMCEVNLGEALMYAGRLDSADMHINSGVEKFENLGVNDRGQAFYISSLLGELALRKGDSGCHRHLTIFPGCHRDMWLYIMDVCVIITGLLAISGMPTITRHWPIR